MSSGISTRLVQLVHPDEGRRAALVDNDALHLLATYRSLDAFAQAALETGWKLRDLLSTDLSGIVLNYGEVHRLETPWRFRPCFDHSEEPGRCVVSTAGPPWRYIASSASLRGHGDSLPAGGSPDVAAVYLIAPDGRPRRIGVAQGHRGRVSALGPELILDPALPRLHGTVRIRAGNSAARSSGSHELSAEVPLLLALASVEPDHFETADFRRPGDVHVHFFGQRLLNLTPVAASEGDEVEIEFESLGAPLRNAIRREEPAARRTAAVPL